MRILIWSYVSPLSSLDEVSFQVLLSFHAFPVLIVLIYKLAIIVLVLKLEIIWKVRMIGHLSKNASIADLLSDRQARRTIDLCVLVWTKLSDPYLFFVKVKQDFSLPIIEVFYDSCQASSW